MIRSKWIRWNKEVNSTSNTHIKKDKMNKSKIDGRKLKRKKTHIKWKLKFGILNWNNWLCYGLPSHHTTFPPQHLFFHQAALWSFHYQHHHLPLEMICVSAWPCSTKWFENMWPFQKDISERIRKYVTLSERHIRK